jgi:3-dehydroquinate dehydratase-2
MLGIREKNTYGSFTLQQIYDLLIIEAQKLGINVEFYQSNVEGELVTAIQKTLGNYDGIIINPGAYGHYSIAIRDAIETVKLPCVEVHISNIYKREEFRHKSMISPVCTGQITGMGHYGYVLGLFAMVNILKGVK